MLVLVTTTAATPDFGTLDQSLQELTEAWIVRHTTAAGCDVRFYRNATFKNTRTARYPNSAAEIIVLNFS